MIQRYQKGSRMSQAVSYGGLVYIAGQVAENRKAGVEDQVRDVLAKIDGLLKEDPNDGRPLIGVARALGYPAGDDPGEFVDEYRRAARHSRTVVDRLFDGS